MSHPTDNKPDDWKARLIGIPLIGALVPFASGSAFEAENEWVLLSYLLISTLYTASIWEACRFITIWTRRRYPGFANTGARVWRQAVGCLLVTVVLVALLCWVTSGTWPTLPAYSRALRMSMVPTVIVMTIYESVYFFEHWKATMLESEQLKRAQVQSQFDTLKNQVNPHFLFNNLNTLVSIIPEDANLAVRFAERLSSVYRYVLQNKDRDVVPLATELANARAYVYLLQIRFGENVRVRWAVPEEYSADMVAPLTLQMLLENAVKHNEVSAARPLDVTVSADDDYLTVHNARQTKRTRPDSTGVGLRNIVERYRLLSERPVTVAEIPEAFVVRLPLLRVATPVPVPAAP